jgi:putative spermidine/putrescine transport system substrate-binding protein
MRGGHSRPGHIDRVSFIAGLFASLVLLLQPIPSKAASNDLTIASFGGAYTRSQILAYIDPYREETKRWVEVLDYDGGIDELEDQVIALNVKWDVVDMTASDALRACDEGLLEPLDGLPLPPAPDGLPAKDDFLPYSLLPCAIGQNIWATVVAYDTDAYRGLAAPSKLADFFDIERFPGSRGLRKSPMVNLEWALLADGAAPEEVYPLLETDAGVERALAVLDHIRPSIVWWTMGEEPLRLVQERRVAMSSAWSGRVFFRNTVRHGDFGIMWDGNVWEREYWVVPKGAPNVEAAKEFISFASLPARQAAQANQIAYSPTRRSAIGMVDDAVRGYFPTAPENAERGFASDPNWWAQNAERLEAAFFEWVDGRKRKKNNRTQH